MLLYQRAAMTHLSADIRLFSLDVLDWLSTVAPEETVSCAGGWFKTLRCFMGLLGWEGQSTGSTWTSISTRTAAKPGAETRVLVKQVSSLTNFIKAGIAVQRNKHDTDGVGYGFPYVHLKQHLPPIKLNPFANLNLFGIEREQDSLMLQDREDRQQVFATNFQVQIQHGIDDLRKEAGEPGRLAAQLHKTVSEGMAGHADVPG